MDSSTPPPVASAPPPLTAAPPSSPPGPGNSSGRKFLAAILSLGLALFLVDGLISLLDNSLILFFGLHALGVIQGLFTILFFLATLVIYILLGITPAMPARLVLPLAFFNPLAALAMIPVGIFFLHRMQQISWAISLFQIVLGIGLIHLVQRGFKLRWPLVPLDQLPVKRFSWARLLGFLAANVFVLAPVVIIYLTCCAGLAINHYTDGFLNLRPKGLTVQVKKYVRVDGKSIQLYPMAHVGDSAFYQKIASSFPTNAIILVEGVSDEQGLLTNKITYKRMAQSLGLTEQQREFKPSETQTFSADVDVSDFGTNTIDFLNLVMRIHARGFNVPDLTELLTYSPAPDFQEQLWNDVLHKRNRHLLIEMDIHLSETDNLVIPWGVAHMPELAKEIQGKGFQLNETQEYVVIGFGKKKR